MALTMELFTIHGRGANGSNCVCVCVRMRAHTCSQNEWKGMMESLKHAVTERRGERRGGLKEEHWVMLAKVKNHAMVQRGLVLSTGRSDYIYAGTQVLLNTLSLVLYVLPLPPCIPPSLRPSLLSPPVLPRFSPGSNGYLLYKSHNMFFCSCLSLTACKTKKQKQKRKKMGPFFIHKLLLRTQKPLE